MTGLAPDAQIETVFADKYLVGEKLGSGGIGSVFKAKHILMDRYVALKRIRPELSEDRLAVRNFHREAMAIANLHHKNIVEVYDFGIGENNEAFMVMEYVAGTNLADILQSEHRLPLERVVHFGAQICSGMEAAHEKGIVHCDLKPSNILISGDRHKETVKLVDFGLAQMMTRELDDQLQQTGKFYVSGTPYYMAPEQCAGRQLDARTDIYSLGCLLFESLTGQTVFKGKTATATFEKHCQMTPPSMAEAYPQGLFSASFERTIAGMLAKDAAHRPQTMSEVRSLLLGAIAGNQFSGSVLGVCRI